MSEYEILFVDLRTWLTEKLPKRQFEDLDRIVDQVTRRDRRTWRGFGQSMCQPPQL